MARNKQARRRFRVSFSSCRSSSCGGAARRRYALQARRGKHAAAVERSEAARQAAMDRHSVVSGLSE